MAQQAAVQKAGFYPIPPEVIKSIANHVPVEKDKHYVVLDPCMGKGEALKVLADDLAERGAKIDHYGCELNGERFSAACDLFGGGKPKEGHKHLACGGTEFLEVSPASISLLYLNPPFDDNGREQERWIRLSHDWVMPGGLLIFITTQQSGLRYSTTQLLSQWYEKCKIFYFPTEHRKFNEVVMVGIRRNGERRYSDWNDRFEPTSGSIRQFATLDIPAMVACENNPKNFAMTVPNLEDTVALMKIGGISQSLNWQEMTRPVSLAKRWRPLRRLGQGHIANMIASGAFRGLPVEDARHGKCLLSGYGAKVMGAPEVEELPDGGKREIRHETPVIYLTAMDLETGKLFEYTSQEPDPMERFILSHLDTLEHAIHKNFAPLFDPETMLQPFLEDAALFNGPGVLAGASRVQLKDGRKGLITAKIRTPQDAVIGYKVCLDNDGQTVDAYLKDVRHTYEKPLPAQITEAAAMAWMLNKSSIGGMVVGQMGTGKTNMALLALYLANRFKFREMRAGSKQHRHTFVVMCPGHIASKWRKEIQACFANFKFAGGPVKVVIPGRDKRRVENYEIVSQTEIACKFCGQKHVVVSAPERKALVTADEKAKQIVKRFQCKNEKCERFLIDFIKTPLQDIDEAFDYRGLSVIILPKDASKLGAEWRGAGAFRTMYYRYQGAVLSEERVRCPICGNKNHIKPHEPAGYVTVGVEGEEFPLSKDVLDVKGSKSKKRFYCRNITPVKVRDEDGNVVLESQTVKVPVMAGDFAGPILDSNGEMTYVERAVMLPKYTLHNKGGNSGQHRCNAPMFQFQALGDGEGARRTELTRYIAKRHRHEYDFIADEVHQYKGAGTTQGQAMQVLCANSHYTLGLTGTPYGGKASSVFYMLYRMFPRFREQFGFEDVSSFVDRYGVKDVITTFGGKDDDEYAAYGNVHKRATTRREEGNGCDPRIIEMFLPQCAFLTLPALHIQLPPRNETFHWLPVDREMRASSNTLHAIRQYAAQQARAGKPSMMTVWMNSELFWPLAPENDVIYIDPDNKRAIEELRKSGNAEAADKLEKSVRQIWAHGVEFGAGWEETSMVKLIADACQRDWQQHKDRSIVYVASQKFYGAKHIYAACKRRGLKPFILTTPSDENVSGCASKGDYAKSELVDRMDVVDDATDAGYNVLIVNPALVAEGVDLVEFNRLHVCGLPNWSVYKFAQSLSRLHRPGQEKTVDMHFWAYGDDPAKAHGDNQLQALAIRTMSDKMRSANVVTGDVGGSLAALNENAGDIMNELRNRLLDDKLMAAPSEMGGSVFSGEVDPMTPFEVAVQTCIEQFEDARLGWASKPVVTVPVKPVVIVRHDETDDIEEAPLPAHIEDEIAAIMQAFDDDDTITEVGEVIEPPMPVAAEPSEIQGDFDPDGPVLTADEYQRQRDDLQKAVEEFFDGKVSFMDDTLIITPNEPEPEAQTYIEPEIVQTNGPEPEAETVVEEISDGGFGIEEVEAEPEAIDPYAILLNLGAVEAVRVWSVVYDKPDFAERVLPGEEAELPI